MVLSRRSSAAVSRSLSRSLISWTIELAVLVQQHNQHKACRQQPVDPAGIKAEIVAAGIEHRAHRDVEQPCAHRHDQPEIEHGIGPAARQSIEREQVQQPHRRDHDDHGRRVVIVLHDGRQQGLAQGRQQRQPANQGDDRRDGARDRDAALAGRLFLQPITGIGDDEERKAAMPEHVEPGRGLRPGIEQAIWREQTGKRQRMHGRHQRGEQITAGKQAQPASATAGAGRAGTPP